MGNSGVWISALGLLLALAGMLAGFAAAFGGVRAVVAELREEIKQHRNERLTSAVQIERLHGDLRVLVSRVDALESTPGDG